jgi:acyl-CoA thioesterase
MMASTTEPHAQEAAMETLRQQAMNANGKADAQVVPPAGTSSFDAAISLAPNGDDGVLDGELVRDWWGGIGPHGGYLAAILVRGLELAVQPGRRAPRSLTVHYLRTASAGPFELRCTRERSGGTLETVSLRLQQGGKPVALGLAAVVASRPSPALREATMPGVPRWSELEVSRFLSEHVGELAPPFALQLEYRHCLGPEPLSGGDEAITGGWLRFHDGRPVDLPAAAMLMDAWWPAAWSRLRSVPRTPTIDLTLHFRDEWEPSPDPVLGVFRTRLAQDGLMDEEGELWSQDGRLLVQSRQLSMLVAPPEAEAA